VENKWVGPRFVGPGSSIISIQVKNKNMFPFYPKISGSPQHKIFYVGWDGDSDNVQYDHYMLKKKL
jgi:hypothetical protein